MRDLLGCIQGLHSLTAQYLFDVTRIDDPPPFSCRSMDWSLSGILDTTVNALVRQCDGLQTLNLRGCAAVGESFRTHNPTLVDVTLSVRFCVWFGFGSPRCDVSMLACVSLVLALHCRC